MTEIGVVILSRYNSRRLPGKALMQIAGKPILQYIYERVRQVFPAENIVVATSAEASDDPIADYCQANDIQVYRGSLDNVAQRFYEAAATYDWDVAVRINGDNIFVDTDLLASMTTTMSTHSYDFLSNVKDRTFPKGMSIEMVRLAYYRSRLDGIENSSAYREHVTLALYEAPSMDGDYHFVYNEALPEAAAIQLALDTPEDFARTKAIIAAFTEPHYQCNLPAIYTIFKQVTHGEELV